MVEKQDSISAHLAAERAIDELRRQSAIALRDDAGHTQGYYPAEFADETLWKSAQYLLLPAARSRTLGLGEKDIRIEAKSLSFAQAMSLANPVAAQIKPPALKTTPASVTDAMAIKLAKYASLLPAMLVLPQDNAENHLTLSTRDMQHYIECPLVDVVPGAKASLPIEGAENTSIISFRTRYSSAVHLALIVGNTAAKAPLTRIHSSCVTGDLLGSLRCDCGDQLKLALSEITREGNGVLIYLHQEGRGIGITNKLRAYQLQEQGVDTYDANLMLGFEEDERDFNIAAAILRALNIPAIRMLTNNPHKMEAIRKAGIDVTERVPLVVKTGRHNHAYLEAKGKKAGHLF